MREWVLGPLAPTLRIWCPLEGGDKVHTLSFYLHSNKMASGQLSRHGWKLMEQSEQRYCQGLCLWRKREVLEVLPPPLAPSPCLSDASQSKMQVITRTQMETTVQSSAHTVRSRPDADCALALPGSLCIYRVAGRTQRGGLSGP